MRKKLCIVLLAVFGFMAKAQVPNSGFESLNSNNNTSYWGEAHLLVFHVDSNGVFHGDSIVWDDPGSRLYFPTTDAYQGMYALEMRNAFNYTTGSMMVGNARLSGDSVDYSAFGGVYVPVSQHPLDLSFYYKYFPAGPDTAIAYITVNDSNGTEIANLLIEIMDTASSYTYISRHINYTLPGTAAYITMGFSNSKPGSPVTFGTRFQVDEVNLQSVGLKQAVDTKEFIDCYPVPVTDKLYLKSKDLNAIKRVRVVNALGEEMLSLDEGYIYSAGIDVAFLAPGIYSIEVQGMNGIVKGKFVK
ncbi:MAG: hypothetical protein K0S33_3326 [Bacteroidetes bacterium]|jgi:hypothetical protein|nr:hypothetical protein [Bacteroidota bacterium]